MHLKIILENDNNILFFKDSIIGSSSDTKNTIKTNFKQAHFLLEWKNKIIKVDPYKKS